MLQAYEEEKEWSIGSSKDMNDERGNGDLEAMGETWNPELSVVK
jgi:hypothetical protein